MKSGKVFRCAIMVFFVGSLGVNLVWAEEIFCAVGWHGEFTHISPTSGQIEPTKFILPTKLQALAWSRDGTLYAGKEGALYTIDPYTGNTELVVVVSTSIRGMAFSPSNDLYITASITFGQQNLRILDIATGDYSDLGALWGDNTASQGLAFSPDGTLYGITANKIQVHELYTIDLDDYEMHLIGSYLMPVDVSQSLTFTPDGSLYAVGDNVFAQLNPDTGAVIGTPISLDGDYRGLAVISGPSAPLAADANGPYTLYAGDTLTLDASGSTDDENDITSYVWDLNDDGVFETDAGTQAIFDVSYAHLESLGLGIDIDYNIHLKVTDGDEQTDTDTTTLLLAANIASADIFGTRDNQFTIEFVNISGDASSANGTNISQYSSGEDGYRTFTDPGNDYRMGTYEITNDQWNKFKASYGTVTGNPSNAYDQSSHWPGADVPVNNLSWYEGTQFVNYLNTSTGHAAAYKFTGTKGTGDYTFAVWESGDTGYDSTNPYRNSNAFYFMPTEDEWVKAAYWNGGRLQFFGTKAGESPTQGDGTSGTGWNYYDGDYATDHRGPWDVGSGSEELNGTFDMMGNVKEQMENLYYSEDYLSGSKHVTRGGSYRYSALYRHDPDFPLGSSYRGYGGAPFYESIGVGFRVASVPAPINHPPVAEANGPYTLYAGDTLTLDASGSTDDANDITSYVWDLDDDGVFETDAGTEAIIDVSYAYLESLGLGIGVDYYIYLKVTDGNEQADTDTTTLMIEPEPALVIAVDIKPQSCPNPFNVNSNGVLPVAIAGSETVDVNDIDVDSIQLAGVSPIRSSYEDVATGLVDPIECECSTEGPDGYIDLTLKFETQAIADALGEAYDGEEFILYLTGYLYDGTPIEGSDCVIVRRKGRR